jgi:cytochrome c biogenesis protein
VNLAACTIRRFARQLRRPARRRHGPDLLHLGLIVLMVGAVVSWLAKGTGSVTLAPGESVTLPDGSTLTVTDFRYERYADGRPKDWVSTLRITKAGVVALDGFELRVNRPLRRGGFTFYQSTYGTVWQLSLRDDAGVEQVLHEGEQAVVGGTTILFMTAEETDGSATGRAVIQVGEGDTAQVARVASGDRVGSATVSEVRGVLATGIEAVADPGWPMVAVALALIAIGTTLTFYQKLRENLKEAS